MPQAQRKISGKNKLRENEKKWGQKLCEAGWTLLPTTILEKQQELGLDPVDLNILMQIAKHWWQSDNPPYPSIRSIADCIAKSPSTVQRRITKLKKRGLIEVEHRKNRFGGQTSSRYRFTGLIEEATELAKEIIAEREEKRRKSGTRRTKTSRHATNTKGLKLVK